MQIENWNIEKIKAYENNPRKNDEAVPKMIEAIKEFGFRVPLLIQSDGCLIDGHLRYKAAVKMELQEVPVIVCDGLSEAQIKAFRLLVNTSVNWASWDNELLIKELSELQVANFDLKLTGFDKRTLERFLFEKNKDKDADNCPQIPEKSKIQTGDLWILGEHRLLCGDCTKDADCQKLLAGEKLDIVWTDPPYGVNYFRKFKGGLKKVKANIKNDKLDTEKFIEFLKAAFSNLHANMKDGAVIYICYSSAMSYPFHKVFADCGFHYGRGLIWLKNHFVLASLGADYSYQHEPIIYGWKEGRHKWNAERKETSIFDCDFAGLTRMEDGKYQLSVNGAMYILSGDNIKLEAIETDVIKAKILQQCKLHPTMKPVALIERMLINSSDKGDKAGDFFAGSGSTLIACENLGRKAYVMEYEAAYCEAIIKRWQEYTGKTAYCETSGLTLAEIDSE